MKLMQKLFSKQTKIKIELCQNNLERFFTEDDFTNYRFVLQQKNVVFKEYQCQSKCKECIESPYVTVNGEVVTAEDSGMLLEKLKSCVEMKESL